ncbi:MAG TPA: hypothetical protein VM759_08915, partial [Longimicrobium sp.]|nr:hypothetical protein [Longimicrobium sp.]
YVSDGDPRTVSYPASMAQYLNREALGGRTPREIAAPAAAAAPTPAPGAQPVAPTPAGGGTRR